MKEREENSKYDKLSITEIESKIFECRVLSIENQAQMYECLEYLRVTCRHKENPRYAKATFWEYLEDRFTIRKNTFQDNSRVFIKYPAHAVEYGVGLIAKIDRTCGGIRVDKVISEIEKENAARKVPITRSKIESIIDKYRKADRVEKAKIDWKSMYEHEKVAHETTKEALRVAMKKLKELNEQIERLKSTAKRTIMSRPERRMQPAMV